MYVRYKILYMTDLQLEKGNRDNSEVYYITPFKKK